MSRPVDAGSAAWGRYHGCRLDPASVTAGQNAPVPYALILEETGDDAVRRRDWGGRRSRAPFAASSGRSIKIGRVQEMQPNPAKQDVGFDSGWTAPAESAGGRVAREELNYS
ncbi:hypothetical protein THAOC_20490 [Thalassiosira oceanica]|uniref:Uncharacterized protein n=1 Tax=Thalassiosira oceanica TaxID=159749 RepID=K0RZQ4_THAOC|nr:hypothetical protein THAOC_20490 [Thalassiosira oceanica]|eukprot:EJK59303.1 hypothetical protein THAOC_20490 [Thalassiosira oceanica]